MARSVSQAARFAVTLSQGTGLLPIRRSYSAAAAPSGRVLKRVDEKAAGPPSPKSKKSAGAPAESSSSAAWVPNPDTGYYMPAGRPAEMDAAEMRQRLLSRRFHN